MKKLILILLLSTASLQAQIVDWQNENTNYAKLEANDLFWFATCQGFRMAQEHPDSSLNWELTIVQCAGRHHVSKPKQFEIYRHGFLNGIKQFRDGRDSPTEDIN
jgi:hypothetical protein